MQREITLTDEQENILSVIVSRTGRTVEQLIGNYLEGWIGQLEPQAKVSEVESKIAQLSDAEKAKALELLEAEKTKQEQPVSVDKG